jgi:hypothetical protein
MSMAGRAVRIKQKVRLFGAHQNDRVTYTRAKSDFVGRVTATARQYYGKAKKSYAPDALPRAGDA